MENTLDYDPTCPTAAVWLNGTRLHAVSDLRFTDTPDGYTLVTVTFPAELAAVDPDTYAGWAEGRDHYAPSYATRPQLPARTGVCPNCGTRIAAEITQTQRIVLVQTSDLLCDACATAVRTAQ